MPESPDIIEYLKSMYALEMHALKTGWNGQMTNSKSTPGSGRF
jgi:hypothetical protein